MIYIKVEADNSVTLAGTVASEQMIADGYIEYNGEIPELKDEFDTLSFVDGVVVLVEDLDGRTNKLMFEINSAIQNHLDNKAKEYRYDNMMSARSYTGYVNPFQAEAQSLSVWASNCWVKAGEIEADVVAGTRPAPTVDEILAEMPVYTA